MGAEQSNSSNARRPSPGNTRQTNANGLSQSEVDRLLQQQKELYEKRMAELLRANISKEQKKPSEESQRSFEPERQSSPYTVTNSSAVAPPSNTVPNVQHAPWRNPGTSSVRPTNVYPDITQLNIDNVNVNATRTTTAAANLDSNLRCNEVSEPFVLVNDPQSKSHRNANKDNELNCPTCNNPFTAYIYQCMSGHSSCRECKISSKLCGAMNINGRICRLPITDRRNVTLEAYIGERNIHCPNSDEGCRLIIKMADVESHLNSCPFREMLCPLFSLYGQCHWKGKLSQMIGHFDSTHQMHRQADVDTEMVLLNVSIDNLIAYLVPIGPYNFLFQAKISERDSMMYMVVQVLGTNNSAIKWTYEIHIYNKRQPRRKYLHTDVCKSIHIPLDNIIENKECAAIPLVYAKSFENEGCLLYKFLIKKGEGEKQVRKYFGNRQHYVRGAKRRNN